MQIDQATAAVRAVTDRMVTVNDTTPPFRRAASAKTSLRLGPFDRLGDLSLLGLDQSSLVVLDVRNGNRSRTTGPLPAAQFGYISDLPAGMIATVTVQNGGSTPSDVSLRWNARAA